MLKFQVSLLSKNCFNFATIPVSQYMLNYTCNNSKGKSVSKNVKTNIEEHANFQEINVGEGALRALQADNAVMTGMTAKRIPGKLAC